MGRAARVAAAALLLVAIWIAGTTGIGPVHAADQPATVAIAGDLVDDHDTPLPGVHLVITEELPPDGGLGGFQATTGPDGVFHADVYAWGTTNLPAVLTIKAAPDAQVTIPVDDQCSRTFAVALDDRRQVTLAENADPKPLDLVATTTLVGEICGTTGTPAPTGGQGGATGTPAPPANAGHGGTSLTPPPTDALRTRLAAADEHLGPALVLGFIAGLAAAALFLSLRPGPRPRR